MTVYQKSYFTASKRMNYMRRSQENIIIKYIQTIIEMNAIHVSMLVKYWCWNSHKMLNILVKSYILSSYFFVFLISDKKGSTKAHTKKKWKVFILHFIIILPVCFEPFSNRDHQQINANVLKYGTDIYCIRMNTRYSIDFSFLSFYVGICES